jgi:hypothetical protein
MMCNKHGTNKLNKKEKSIHLKNLLVGEKLVRCIKQRDTQVLVRLQEQLQQVQSQRPSAVDWEYLRSVASLERQIRHVNSTFERWKNSHLNDFGVFRHDLEKKNENEKDLQTNYFNGSKHNDSCFSPATSDALRYVILLEEDQFIPQDALLRVIETILHSAISSQEGPVGFYSLCDSYCQGMVIPHAYLNGTPYSNGYASVRAKTAAAVMLSEKTIKEMYFNNHWLPIRRAMDHWYNYIIYKEQVRVQYVFPPISCHGSQGIEDMLRRGWKTRYDSQHCCDSYYDLRTMKSHFVRVKLFDRNQ